MKEISKKDKNAIIGAIRQIFRYSDLHKQVKRRARVEKREGFYKNGRQKTGIWYQCAICKKLHKDKGLAVDHIQPIGAFEGSYDSWIRKAWCLETGGAENLQVVCKECHKKKTKRERDNRKR